MVRHAETERWLPARRALRAMGLRCATMLAAALFAWTAALAQPAADRRVALVVGNSAYRKVTPLPNPRNDASDVAAALTALGFEVITALDADLAGFNQALGRFSRRAAEADAALFYYAGHGVQLRSQNYFLPVDADPKDEISAEFEFVAMERVNRALDKATAAAVRIVVLDACRDNPLARSVYAASRNVGEPSRGLARLDAARGGTIVVYATQPNEVAQDGAERNSPFTSALLKRLREPGLEVASLFRRVAEDVRSRTGGRQVPELSISIGRDYYLNREESDLAAFDRVAASADPRDFREFLRRFPQSSRATLAKSLADTLESNAELRRRAQEEAARADAEAKALARVEAERRAEHARLEAARDETARQERQSLEARRQEERRLEAVRKAMEVARRARVDAESRRADAEARAQFESDRKAVEQLAELRARARAAVSEGGKEQEARAQIEADRRAVEQLAAARREARRRNGAGEPATMQ